LLTETKYTKLFADIRRIIAQGRERVV